MSFDPISYILGAKSGGGGGVTVEPLSVNENGTYQEPGKAFSPVSVNVGGSKEYTFETPGSNVTRFLSTRTITPRIDKVTIRGTYSGAMSAENVCANASIANNIVLTIDNGVSTLKTGFDKCDATHITINASTSACTSYATCFRANTNPPYRTVVDGFPLDLSSVSSSDNQKDMVGESIVEMRFVPSSCVHSWQNQYCLNVSDATLVSMANALDGTVTGQTLTIHATPKARCQTLMGTVADGLFTADESGTVTLAEFITTVKGWTLG